MIPAKCRSYNKQSVSLDLIFDAHVSFTLAYGVCMKLVSNPFSGVELRGVTRGSRKEEDSSSSVPDPTVTSFSIKSRAALPSGGILSGVQKVALSRNGG